MYVSDDKMQKVKRIGTGMYQRERHTQGGIERYRQRQTDRDGQTERQRETRHPGSQAQI